MGKNKLVSILIPAYNAEKWIAESIHSAVIQTWPTKEIIVIDDGSTDSTLEIAKRFESRLVKVFTQAHSGAAATRNKALNLSQGDYIQWLDSDDILAPDKIEIQMKAAEQFRDPYILFSSAWAKCFRNIKKAKFEPNELWKNSEAVDWLINKLSHLNWMAIECWLISRTLANLAGPWDNTLKINIDGEYISRVIINCKRIVFIPSARVYCREMNPSSISKGINSLQGIKSSFLALEKECNNLIKHEDSKRTRRACALAIYKWLEWTYPESLFLYRKAYEIIGQLDPEMTNLKLPDKKLRLFGIRLPKRTYHFYKLCKKYILLLFFKFFYLIRIR